MNRSLLVFALVAAAGAAGAQNMSPPTVGGTTINTPPINPNPSATPPLTSKPLGPRIVSETDARAAIEAGGYKSVSNLRMGADGKWSGSAMRDNQQIAVSVDAEGNVASH